MVLGATYAKVGNVKVLIEVVSCLGTAAAGIGTLFLAWYGANAFKMWGSQYRLKDVFVARRELYDSGVIIAQKLNKLTLELNESTIDRSSEFFGQKKEVLEKYRKQVLRLQTDYSKKWISLSNLLEIKEQSYVAYSYGQLSFEIGKILVCAYARLDEIKSSGNKDTTALIQLPEEFQRFDKALKDDFIGFWKIVN